MYPWNFRQVHGLHKCFNRSPLSVLVSQNMYGFEPSCCDFALSCCSPPMQKERLTYSREGCSELCRIVIPSKTSSTMYGDISLFIFFHDDCAFFLTFSLGNVIVQTQVWPSAEIDFNIWFQIQCDDN